MEMREPEPKGDYRMTFKELKEEFDRLADESLFKLVYKDMPPHELSEAESAERLFRYWLLRLLFEINGNLDSLSVAYREILKLQKERAGK